MAKYRSAGGGQFKNHKNVGDRIEGTLVGTRKLDNKFKPGVADLAADFVEKNGTKFVVRVASSYFKGAWEAANPQPGEYVVMTLVGFIPSKQGQPGKDIEIEIPSRPEGVAAAAAPKNNVKDNVTPIRPTSGLDAMSYADLKAKALEHLGDAGKATVSMLEAMHSDDSLRAADLRRFLTSQGVTA